MDNIQYDLYVAECRNLAATLVVKSEVSIASINNNIARVYGQSAVGDTPQEWKYYRNICGLLHSTDSAIYITSIDDDSTIEFSKANLARHKGTYKAYAYGTRYYKELIEKHPNMQQYILGVLYPVDMDVAMAATDGTILGYPSHLVEPYEYSFIGELQKRVTNILTRWRNSGYAIYHDYFETIRLGLFYAALLPTILNIRKAACFTHEVHSFHIRAYLASNGVNEKYIPFLNRKQLIFLYKNIRYIQRNLGQQQIQRQLIQILLTEREIPLEAIILKHDVTLLASVENTTLLPELTFKKVSLNDIITSDADQIDTYQQLLDRQIEYNPKNAEYLSQYGDEVHEALKVSPTNVLRTKVLESNAIDYTDATLYTRAETLFNYWALLAFNNSYRGYIVFKNPKTGEAISLSARDAYIYTILLGLYYVQPLPDLDIAAMPISKLRLRAHRVQRYNQLNFNVLRPLADTAIISDFEIQAIIDAHPTIDLINTLIVNAEDFYLFCNRIYNAQQFEWRLVSNKNHFMNRVWLKRFIDLLYTTKTYNDHPSLSRANGNVYTVAEWLDAKLLPQLDFTPTETIDLITEIYTTATGVSALSTDSKAAIQKAMIGLMSDLSSYTVQYLHQINENPIVIFDNQTFAMDDPKREATHRVDIWDSALELGGSSYHYTLSSNLETGLVASDISVGATRHGSTNASIIANFSNNAIPKISILGDSAIVATSNTPNNFDSLSTAEKIAIYFATAGATEERTWDLSGLFSTTTLGPITHVFLNHDLGFTGKVINDINLGALQYTITTD